MSKLTDFQLLLQCESGWPGNVKSIQEALERDFPTKYADHVFVVLETDEGETGIVRITTRAGIARDSIVGWAAEYETAIKENADTGLPYAEDPDGNMVWIEWEPVDRGNG